MKKILFLGAAHFQMPPIKYAIEAGYYTITVDNVVDNPGHKISNKSYNVSTVDKNNILKIAENEKVDGVLAFGSDLSMLTCSYVTDNLNLPGNDYKSIESLVYKSKFREALVANGIQDFYYKIYTKDELNQLIEFISASDFLSVLKPIDGNGSKGVSIIDPRFNNEKKIKNAFDQSLSGKVIIEKFIKKKLPQICGDGFFQNGRLKFIYFGDGYFYPDNSYLAPWGETFPSMHDKNILLKAENKIENILIELGFKTGPFNFDIFITEEDEVFINEIGPRAGGNFIPIVIKYQTGVDMIKGAVESCLDNNYNLQVDLFSINEYFGSYMIHSKIDSGYLKSISISDSISDKIHEVSLYKVENDYVEPFISGNKAIGNVILKTESIDELRNLYNSNIHKMFELELS